MSERALRHRAAGLRAMLAPYWPAAMRVDARERWRSAAGGALGILLAGWLSRWTGGAGIWLVAPIGASAVLVFAVPASPLAQPWSVIGGNTLSALIGAACAIAIPDPVLAGAAAVGIAIGVMFQLRCLHPPGGAAALLCALGAVGFKFVLFPVLLNCVLLSVAGIAYNRLVGRRYPHHAAPPTTGTPVPATGSNRFSTVDLDAALAHYNQVVDMSRDDLGELLDYAQAAAYQRRFGGLRCGDVMSREPLAVQFGTTLDEAWTLMVARRIKALPVIDRSRRIVGIVTRADFLRAANLGRRDGIGTRMRDLLRASGRVHGEKPEVVGQIMTREVRVASVARRVSELAAVFSDDGHHHLPVIDADKRLVGVITQSDFVRALYHATDPQQ